MKSSGPSLDPAAEDALILRVQHGDLNAFEPLVDLHLPHVRAFIALRTPAAHLVDELAHEVFVYAFRHISEFTAGTSLGTWLRAIAWNLLRAEIQRFSREQSNLTRYAHARRLELADRADAVAGSKEAEVLEQCIEELPATMRRLLDLKYHADHSSEAIARNLNRSTAWVWTTLFRVRQQLKACIEGKRGGKQPC
ncbi:MAG: sigma-70 family RNA polymerase sigma factor [Verrucomicrobiales bacterium]|nr:sigma-70 family RNA polymerase sigma factor [Verrucomicrobiales bacterium]